MWHMYPFEQSFTIRMLILAGPERIFGKNSSGDISVYVELVNE